MNWSDPDSFWLMATNLGLAAVVLICVAAIALRIAAELREQRRESAGIDVELRQLVADVGATMADGGEPVKHPEKK